MQLMRGQGTGLTSHLPRAYLTSEADNVRTRLCRPRRDIVMVSIRTVACRCHPLATHLRPHKYSPKIRQCGSTSTNEVSCAEMPPSRRAGPVQRPYSCNEKTIMRKLSICDERAVHGTRNMLVQSVGQYRLSELFRRCHDPCTVGLANGHKT